MLKLKIAISAKTGNTYSCLVYLKGDKTIVLTFDKIVIMRVCNLTYDALSELGVGLYDIK